MVLAACSGQEAADENAELTQEEQDLTAGCECIKEEIALLEAYNNNADAAAADFETMMNEFKASECGTTLFEKCGTEEMWNKLKEQCAETNRKIELWEEADAKNEALNASDSTAVAEELVVE